ncbi:MAG: hypothetical protein WC381_07045 [Kiritimatiellia bacterium]|jgi:predicted HicB family RNase H-like nuclease
MSAKKVFPVELDETLHRRLKHAAIDEGITLHDLILRVLDEHVGHNGLKQDKGRGNDQSAIRGC